MKDPLESRYLPLALLATVLVTILVAVLVGVAAFGGDSTPQAIRTVLERQVGTDLPDKEITLGTAKLPAGSAIGWHTHDGDEFGYVLEGDLVLRSRGQPDRNLKAGDHFFNPRGLVHSLAAAPGTAGGAALSTWIIDKGRPLSEPVN